MRFSVFCLFLLLAGFGWVTALSVPTAAIKAGHNSLLTRIGATNGTPEAPIQKGPNSEAERFHL